MKKIPTTRFEPEPDDDRFCSGCSACCRWSGDVIFSPHSLAPIAALLNLDERECAELYFDLADDRHHLKAVETADGRCPFLVEDNCIIYHLRPPRLPKFPLSLAAARAGTDAPVPPLPSSALSAERREGNFRGCLPRMTGSGSATSAMESEIIPRKREAGAHSSW